MDIIVKILPLLLLGFMLYVHPVGSLGSEQASFPSAVCWIKPEHKVSVCVIGLLAAGKNTSASPQTAHPIQEDGQ